MNRTTSDTAFPCCGGLFFTQIEAGSVVLECSVCGRRWERDNDEQWRHHDESHDGIIERGRFDL